MKAQEAKELSAKACQIKETLKQELLTLYSEIQSNALSGLVAYHFHRGYLTSGGYDSKYLEEMIVNHLIQNGYVVKRQYHNINKPWLLISWM